MQRARRLMPVAAIAAVGILALAGCRSAPGVAAYTGDRELTEDQVTRIVDDVKEKAGEAKVQPPSRTDVVRTVVLGDLCARLSAEKGYRARAQVSAEQVAQQLRVPADSTYAQQTAQLHSCLSGVPSGQPVAPTGQDLADLVARGKAAGVIPADVSVEEAGTQLDGDQLRGALATKKTFADAVSAYGVTVNPRYRPLEFPLLSFQGNAPAVSVPLGEGDSGAVVAPR